MASDGSISPVKMWACLYLDGTDGIGVELDEEMAGWNRLLDALPVLLPGCKPLSEWLFAVAFPAFAPNPTEIYARSLTYAGESQITQ